MRSEQRRQANSRRRKPGDGRLIRIPFDGVVSAITEGAQPPSEIQIEPTNEAGEAADWLNDYFWGDLLQQWADEVIAVHFLPTPQSLLHPVIIHQTYMLRRITEHWRVIGNCYLSDLAAEGRLAQAAVSPYHEIRIIDGVRAGVPRPATLRIEDALARMREAQAAQGRTTPILVRCAPPTPAAAPSITPTRTAPLARSDTPTTKQPAGVTA